MNLFTDSWPWYITGPLIGLAVPVLLLLGNYSLGVSSTFRYIGSICTPNSRIPYVKNSAWRQHIWKLVFVLGIVIGGFIASYLLSPTPVQLLPESYSSLQGVITLAIGGILVGFGTRWAAGCTSGHSILGMATLQWTSLLATVFFFVGGLIATWLILPLIF